MLASNAMATFPPARRSPMMPEPTTEANNNAVPSVSATARRATASFRDWFYSANEPADEFALHF